MADIGDYVTAWREGQTYIGDVHSCWNDEDMFRDFISDQIEGEDEDDIYDMEFYEVEGILVEDDGGYDGWRVKVSNIISLDPESFL